MESQNTNLPAIPNGKKTTRKFSCPFCVGTFVDKDSYVDHLINYHHVDWDWYQKLERPSVDKENLASNKPKKKAKAVPKIKREESIQIKQDEEKPGSVSVPINNEQIGGIHRGIGSHKTSVTSLNHTEKEATIVEDTKDAVINPVVDPNPDKTVSNCSIKIITVLEVQPVEDISHLHEFPEKTNSLVTMAELALREKPNPKLTMILGNEGSNLSREHAQNLILNESDDMAGVLVESRLIETNTDDQMDLDIVLPSPLVNQSSGSAIESSKQSRSPTEVCELKKKGIQAVASRIMVHDAVPNSTSDATFNSKLDNPMGNAQAKIADYTSPLQLLPAQGPSKRKISLANYSKKKQQQSDETQAASGPSNVTHKKEIISNGAISIDTLPQALSKHSLEFGKGLSQSQSTLSANVGGLNPIPINQEKLVFNPVVPAANVERLAPTPGKVAKLGFNLSASAFLTMGKESVIKDSDSLVGSISKSSDRKKSEAMRTIPLTKTKTKTAVQEQKTSTTKPQVSQAGKQSDSQPMQFLSRSPSSYYFSEQEDIDIDSEAAGQEEIPNDDEPSNTQLEPEEFPILLNPVLPKLGTGGALASFLKSKENEKAAEWNFWGPSATTTVAPFKPLQVTEITTNRPTANMLPLKGKAPHVAQKKDEPILYQSDKTNQQKATSETDHVIQRNAIFLTDNGRVTTFPPGAVGSKAWNNNDDPYLSMEDGEICEETTKDLEGGPQFSQKFVSRMRNLEDLQYNHNDFGYARDVSLGRGGKNAPWGPVGGQLPVALRCPECCRFHQGKCGVPPEPCIICGGKHWAKQCNSKNLQIARIFRPGISCNRCLFMHKGSCPPPNACPVCLQIHDGLCLKPSGTCRYCGFMHWENACPRWEALDEEMGFYEKPKEGKQQVAFEMQEKVTKYWSPKELFSNNYNQEKNGNNGLGEGKCVTQTDFIGLLSVEDEKKSLQPTYANAKALKRDINSVLRGKSGLGHVQPRTQRSRSPMETDHHEMKGAYPEHELRIPRGPHNIAEEDNHYNDRTKLGTKTHARVPEILRKESSHSINPPSPSEIRSRREDIWGRDRARNRNSDLEKRKSYGRDTRDKEHEPEGRDREHRHREKKDRNDGAQHRRTEWEKEGRKGKSSDKLVMERLDSTEPHYVRKTVNERLRGLEEKSCNKRAPSTDRPGGVRTGRESVAGGGGSGSLEKWGDFDMYTKRRRRE